MLLSEFLFPKLPTSAQMAKWDKSAIEFGIPDIMLMENASRSALNLLPSIQDSTKDRNVLVLMGGGNNGGDAVCMARILHDGGVNVLVAHTKKLSDLKGAARFHAELAIKDGLSFYEINRFPEFLDYLYKINFIPDIILDGLIGVALHGSLSEDLHDLINNINFFALSIKAWVMAIDVPSGLNADTGLPMPCAIKASITACMAYAKQGLVQPQARHYTGKVFICDIGMPICENEDRIPDLCLLDGRILLTNTNLPQKSHKNVYGHVIIIGGSNGLSGACHLASLAALRMGAGLVTACSPPSSINMVKSDLAELMTLSLGDGDNWPETLPDNFLELLEKSDSLVIGPGMGRDERAFRILHEILRIKNRPPTVFDADALFHLANNPDWLSLLTEKDVITPHPGEAASLLKCTVKELEGDRLKSLKALISKTKAVIILKGVNTLIGREILPALICPYDIPQMAIGGAGDVLSGCIGALLAKKNNDADIIFKCANAVISHVCAGRICSSEFPNRGALASDLANALANVSKYIMSLDKSGLNMGQVPWP